MNWFLLLLLQSLCIVGFWCFPIGAVSDMGYKRAPVYRNGVGCPLSDDTQTTSYCDPSLVHIAMTLDSHYLRGSIAAVHSVLRHATCPDHLFFHFITAEFDPNATPRRLSRLVSATFPSLNHKLYILREDSILNLISSSLRPALDNPLNYARNYLGDLLHPCVTRVLYLDSDLVLLDDVRALWHLPLHPHVIAAPQYCHANFTSYFSDTFWSDPVLPRVFQSRSPCYFNTGVMLMDLDKYREGNYRAKIEWWMRLQRKRRIYELGSLPPFLLVFAGNVEPIDHKWNQHGLGGDNVKGSCRWLHPGPVSLLHWSGKGKPWARLDDNTPCPLDYLWEPYDLHIPN